MIELIGSWVMIMVYFVGVVIVVLEIGLVMLLLFGMIVGVGVMMFVEMLNSVVLLKVRLGLRISCRYGLNFGGVLEWVRGMLK